MQQERQIEKDETQTTERQSQHINTTIYLQCGTKKGEAAVAL